MGGRLVKIKKKKTLPLQISFFFLFLLQSHQNSQLSFFSLWGLLGSCCNVFLGWGGVGRGGAGLMSAHK